MRFSIEPSVRTPGAEVLSHARSFELATALINRAERLVPRTVHGNTHCKIGGMVLLRRGRLPEVSKFQSSHMARPLEGYIRTSPSLFIIKCFRKEVPKAIAL